jgi:hypothetical protein
METVKSKVHLNLWWEMETVKSKVLEISQRCRDCLK